MVGGRLSGRGTSRPEWKIWEQVLWHFFDPGAVVAGNDAGSRYALKTVEVNIKIHVFFS